MQRKWKVVGPMLAILALSGCASMSSEECIATDWSAVGYEDGARGFTSERFSKHRTACAKHGVKVDFAAYQAGREQGLVEYCQPGRGYDVGVSGGRYYAYNAGHYLYTLRSNVSRTSSQIGSKKRKLKDVKSKIRDKEAELIAEETTTEQRVLLLADLKELSERTGQIENEIQVLYQELAQYQLELDNYQANNVGY